MAADGAPQIHETAHVAEGAEIGAGAQIGPFCTIGAQVRIGPGTVLTSHVAVAGRTTIGAENCIFPFASLGQIPQDLKYAGEPTELVIGDGNTIRESTTMNIGTAGGGGVTRIGDGCLFMNICHVGHDCQIGNGVIMATGATLGGHVTIGDGAIIGGLAAVHQFCRIGTGAMISGLAAIAADVIPYASVTAQRARMKGLNVVGLRRRDIDKDRIKTLRTAYIRLFEDDGAVSDKLDAVAHDLGHEPLVREMLDFIAAGSSRQFTAPE
ncbi:MAG: acyl-ACP--UDP-N-acetylglucosamine O-acyltransferase [Pseudomonadota bacterium]